MPVKPASGLHITSRQIPQWRRIPNTSIQSKPLLIYHQAFDASADELSKHLEEIGEVCPSWVYTMYSQTHFHSTSHEVLGVVSGSARLCFGGEDNPERVEPEVSKGDLIIVPAGVGHRLLSETDKAQGLFKMVGAYPRDKSWDMCYGRPGEEESCQAIESLDWFQEDPLYGKDGPALRV
ncbi:RmlC-like cupin domain-containing protein [Aspergillus karnatakaensis]|uniref:cupin domain-containing protein n=1 Tax=Aspergillus karnatakaensis TaxID=1810916 RepID=UPI003CCE401C